MHEKLVQLTSRKIFAIILQSLIIIYGESLVGGIESLFA